MIYALLLLYLFIKQVQLTDFENAAYAIFIVLMTRVILSYRLNLLIPISKVKLAKSFDETIQKIHNFDGI